MNNGAGGLHNYHHCLIKIDHFILYDKGEIIEMGGMIQNHINFCVKVQVIEEVRNVFNKNLKENEEIYQKIIKN